ncbi:unnamed protein product [Didymodactylos carnosus]|uniref:Uncharacterized protein n=1 Tax=Didymodactylos carnosus TaxID=1234261 RepID=A0A814FYH9_9BILA|nr:unnamed protein product [Didymodactylos carnosus]CAF0986590.1 unnamed protein product [Didymodactylos carnosus]CAF3617113.1 unnamed protein product [Didymodactylos carnosus]CAF3758831.1 unnamed protein product [Didymodactylos carnosus]
MSKKVRITSEEAKGIYDCQIRLGNRYRDYVQILRSDQNIPPSVQNLYQGMSDVKATSRIINYLQGEGRKAAEIKAKQHLNTQSSNATAAYFKPLVAPRRGKTRRVNLYSRPILDVSEDSSPSPCLLNNENAYQQQQADANEDEEGRGSEGEEMDIDDEIMYQQPVFDELPSISEFQPIRRSSFAQNQTSSPPVTTQTRARSQSSPIQQINSSMVETVAATTTNYHPSLIHQPPGAEDEEVLINSFGYEVNPQTYRRRDEIRRREEIELESQTQSTK